MNFLNVKFLISVGIVILIALGGASFEIWRLNRTIESITAQLQEARIEMAIKDANLQITTSNLFECNAKIELVNEKTQSLRAKSEEAEQKAKRAGERLARLQTPQKDAGCERELKFYKELMNASY